MGVKTGIGISQIKDSFIAGVQAARQATAQVKDPNLVLVFGNIHYDHEELGMGERNFLMV